MTKLRLSIIVATVIPLCLATAVRAQWSPGSPYGLPAGFNSPLNTTTETQTKTGVLTVNGTYSAGSSTQPTDLNVTGQICWNNDCRSDWNQVGTGNFVHLFSNTTFTADTGSPILVGDTSQSPIALLGLSGLINGRATYGLSGLSASAFGPNLSAGVFGESNNPSGIAVYGLGIQGQSAAYAGYFIGKVRLLPSSDLIVGPVGNNSQSARASGGSYLCLGDTGGAFSSVCKSTWDNGNVSAWTRQNGVLWAGQGVSWVAAGSSGSAFFRVQPRPDSTNDVSVSGSATFRQTIIGTPSASTPIALTCGDGICNGAENDTFGNPNFCAIDCDHTAPPVLVAVGMSLNVIARTATFTWTVPASSTDVLGTRIVYKIGSPSTGPTDGTLVQNKLLTTCPSRNCTYVTPTLATNTSYYYSFYLYDYASNHSPGIWKLVRFNAGGGGPPPPGPPVGGGF